MRSDTCPRCSSGGQWFYVATNLQTMAKTLICATCGGESK